MSLATSRESVPTPAAPAPPAKRSVVWRDFSMLIALTLIWGFFAIEQPVFLSPRNLSLLSIELSVTATLALGMLIVLLPGQIDLSAGSGVGLTGAIAAVLVFQRGVPAPLALLAATLVALVVWTAMGALIIRQRIPSFIITLGGLLVFKGLHWLTIKGQTIPVVEGGKVNAYALLTTYYLPPVAGYVLAAAVFGGLVFARLHARRRREGYGFPVDDGELTFLKLMCAGQLLLVAVLVTNQYRGVPLAFVILGLVALGVYVLTQHTPLGRQLYAIGGNEEAAFISGVPIERVVIAAFALMGLVVALSGFMQTAYSGASTSTVGSLMELDAVAACVIGGTSLRGGRGTVLGVLFGALIMASLLNGMTLMAVSPEIKLIARGAVLALAVWVDVRLSGR
jgi:D-xylose transport system permease protein